MLPRLVGEAIRSSEGFVSHIAESFARSQIDPSHHLILIVMGDCAIGLGAYLLAFSLRSWLPFPFTSDLLPSERFFQVKHYWLLLLGLQPVLLFFLDAYHEIRLKGGREFALSVAGATTIQVMMLIAAYFYSENLHFPRSIFPIYWALNGAGLLAWRILLKRVASCRKRRVLIVGSGALAEQLIAELRQAPEIGMEVVGIASDRLSKGHLLGPYKVLGEREDIPHLIRAHQIEEVILTPETSWKDQLVDSISRLEGSVRISIIPSVYEILIGRVRHFNIRDIPIIEMRANPNDPVSAFFRRLSDLFMAALLIVSLLPLWAIVALAIKLSDGGPIFYSQERVGRGGRIFRLIKFRTMPEDAENETGPVLARSDDPRLTSLGQFLRGYRIDESLQLLNVLKGDMSLVGPRPDRPEFVAQFASQVHGYNERHKVKPGITGLAQIRGYYHSDPAVKLKYDLAYVYNNSFLLDLVIIFETVRIILRRQGV